MVFVAGVWTWGEGRETTAMRDGIGGQAGGRRVQKDVLMESMWEVSAAGQAAKGEGRTDRWRNGGKRGT